MSRIRLTCAGVIVGATLLGAFLTLNPEDRVARTMPAMRLADAAVPTWACPSGYDRFGQCVGQNLAGGIHSLLMPMFWSIVVGVLGGVLLALVAGGQVRWLSQVMRGTLEAIEALPRLVMVLLIYVLFDHQLIMVGVGVGVLSIPGIVAEIRSRSAQLERTEFIQSARLHGITSRRIFWHYLLWLECRRSLAQSCAAIGAQNVIIQVTLGFLIPANISEQEVNWGTELNRVAEGLFEFKSALLEWSHMSAAPIRGPIGLLNAVLDLGHLAWRNRMPQLASVVICILGLTWALHTIARALEVRRGGYDL